MNALQQHVKHLLMGEAEGWDTEAAPAMLTPPHRFFLHDETDTTECYLAWTDPGPQTDACPQMDLWGKPETYYTLRVVLDVLGYDTPQRLNADWQETLGHRTCLPLYLHPTPDGQYVALVPESVILTQLIGLIGCCEAFPMADD